MYTGSCLCGGVQFSIEVELESIQVCHCQQCRKAHGTPFATSIPVKASAFRITQGAELLSGFESSPGKRRLFCSRCGSPVISKKESLPDVVRVRAGTINELLRSRPIAHFHVASKCNWWPINDALPQFPESYVPGEATRTQPVRIETT